LVRKPKGTTYVGTRIPMELAIKFYKVASEKYESNLSEALRAAIKLLVKHEGYEASSNSSNPRAHIKINVSPPS